MKVGGFFLDREMQLPARIARDFHMIVHVLFHSARISPPQFPLNSAFLGSIQFYNCTIFCHPAVKTVHLARFKRHKQANFLLTPELVAVKQTRSLARSKVFPVGAESGAQARSHAASQDAMQRGSARVKAKRWLRRTRTQVKGRIESRGVELVYPVGGEPGAQVKVALHHSQEC